MPAIINFEPHRKATNLLAQLFVIEDAVNGALDLTGALITMQLKTGPEQPPQLQLDSNGNGITITDAVAGKFEIDEQIIDIPAFDYLYGIEIVSPTIPKDEFIAGIFPITQDLVQ